MAAELVISATSEKLTEMDWTKNIEICELVAREQRQAKDVIKAIKKRLGSKNPNTQLYAVMLLEMLMNNIGDNIYKQVIDIGVLPILVKIVKKKSDLPVRERIFLLLDATQTSLGGASGKFPQYYTAYYDLVSAGVQFPQRPRAMPSNPPTSRANVDNTLNGQLASTRHEGAAQHLEPQIVPESSTIQKANNALELLKEVLDAVNSQNAWNSMVDTYASCGQMDDATMLFDSMPLKNRETFNIMVSGYARTGRIASARSIFDTISVPDIVSWNSIILAYAQAGDMEKACELFKQAPIKNVITWNTMMTGYLGRKFYSEVIDLFHEMKAQKFEPDHLTVAAVVSASTHLGSLETGTRLHIYAKENDLETSPHVTTALIEMYAKCGSIRNSLEVFYKSQIKDIYCWNAILSGLAVHGYGHAALKLFHRMRNGTTSPDDITFIALLNACSHSGLVQEGCQLFKSMEEDFGLSPKLEHFGCLVDLLGRAGLLDQAIQLVEAMPFEPGEYILGALLSACVTHRNLETGERAMNLISAGAGDLTDGEFMMFANLYASCGLWDEANKWRELMNNTGILKTAGCSSVEINGKFHRFLAGEVDMKLNLKLP